MTRDRVPKPGRRRLLPAGVATALLLGVAVLLAGYRAVFPPRFACVTPGVLYRSGQPDGVGLRLVHRRHGIRTVINLRSKRKVASDPLAQQEVAYVRSAGLRFHVLSLTAKNLPRIAREFLRLVRDPATRPVLVHCAGGRERAGTLVAVYRMVEQNWGPERALREMKQFGFELEGNAAFWEAAKTFAEHAHGEASSLAAPAHKAGATCRVNGTDVSPPTCAPPVISTAVGIEEEKTP